MRRLLAAFLSFVLACGPAASATAAGSTPTPASQGPQRNSVGVPSAVDPGVVDQGLAAAPTFPLSRGPGLTAPSSGESTPNLSIQSLQPELNSAASIGGVSGEYSESYPKEETPAASAGPSNEHGLPGVTAGEFRPRVPSRGEAGGTGPSATPDVSNHARIFDGSAAQPEAFQDPKDKSELLAHCLKQVRAGAAGPLPQEALDAHYLLVPGLNWDLLSPNYFRPNIERLRSLGLNATMVETDALAHSVINAPVVAAAIRGLKGPVFILAHSQGGMHGLRALKQFPELLGKSVVVVTLGTPHRGSPLADWFLPRLWLYYAFMAAGRLLKLRRIFSSNPRFWHASVKELSRQHARPDDFISPDVVLFSVAGRLTRKNVLLRIKSRVFKALYGEDNDGVVAVRDAVHPASRYYAIVDNVKHAGFVAGGGWKVWLSGVGAKSSRHVEDLTEAIVRWAFHERLDARGPPRSEETAVQTPRASLPLPSKTQGPAALPVFKKAALWGAAAAVLAPVLFHAAPPLMVLYTAPLALAAVGISWGLIQTAGGLHRIWEGRTFGPPSFLGLAVLFGLAFSAVFSQWLQPRTFNNAVVYELVNAAVPAGVFWMAAKTAYWAAQMARPIVRIMNWTRKKIARAMHAAFSGPVLRLGRPIVRAMNWMRGKIVRAMRAVFSGSALRLWSIAGALAVGWALGRTHGTYVDASAAFIYGVLILFSVAAIARSLMGAAVSAIKLLSWLIRPKRFKTRFGTLNRKVVFAAVAGLGLGGFAGVLPSAHRGPVLEIGSGLIKPVAAFVSENTHPMEVLPEPWQRGIHAMAEAERDMHEIGPAFGEEIQRVFMGNPRGRALLDALRDRSGQVRMPRFFVSKLEYSGMTYFPPLDVVFIGLSDITNNGWTIEEFLEDPVAQRQLARQYDDSLFHEMIHRRQFWRSAFFPGQGKNFPRYTFSYYNVDLEHEAHIEQMLYIHEKLKADPYVPRTDGLSNYTAFLDSMFSYLEGIDNDPTYQDFAHVNSDYYLDYIIDVRRRWPAISVEGYLLLHLRALKYGLPTYTGDYLKKALDRAKEYGLPEPSLKDVGR